MQLFTFIPIRMIGSIPASDKIRCCEKKRKTILRFILYAFLLVSSLQVQARTQIEKINLKGKQLSLEQALESIENQSGYTFWYNKNLLDLNKKLDLDISDATLDKALQLIFKEMQVSYEVNDKTISLKKKEVQQGKTLSSYQKDETVRGRVTDTKGNPLAGASVRIKGQSSNVVTGSNGNFEVNVPNSSTILIITFIGYTDQEILAADAKINTPIQLSEQHSELDNVQIIAYGTTTQRFSTGNITTVTSKELERQPVNNIMLALSAKVPGMFITQSNGLSGSGVTTLIQGQNSIGKGNDPFYVIDGVPYVSQLLNNSGTILGRSGVNITSNGNPLSYINPSDIESVTVLKDADATAIYGSRAANGAILITTKKGKAGRTRTDIRLQSGIGEVAKKMKLLDTQQFLTMRKEGIKNDGGNISPTDYDINGYWDTTRYTDWQKELIGGSAKYTNINATVSGGSSNTQYLIGGTYHKETTVYPADFRDVKGSLHFSLSNTSANEKFKLQLTGNYLVDNNSLPDVDLTSRAILLSPTAPRLYNSDGSLNWMPNTAGSSTWTNPLAPLNNNYRNKTSNLVSNLMLNYRLFPGLEFQSSFGYTNMQTNETTLYPLTAIRPENRRTSTRSTTYGSSSINTWIIEPQLTYNSQLGAGKLDALIGATLQQNNSNGSILSGIGYNSDAVMADMKSAASIIASSTTIAKYKYNALFARLNYNLENKYIVNLTVRRDGSSRFGSENMFHNFGALGASWIFSEEKLIKNNFRFLSFGKLRFSYGTTGNDQINDYQFLSLYNPINPGVPYQGAIGLSPTRLTNPNLQWEQTHKLNAGIDLGFLKERVLVNVNYFKNRSSNQLVQNTISNITGFSFVVQNFPATVQNTGLEGILKTINVKSSNFQWNTNINFTIPKNKLVKYDNISKTVDANRLIVGQPITLRKVYHFAGVDPATGQFQFADKDGNPTLNPNSTNDATVYINTSPTIYGGFENTFTYKNVSLSILFQFVKRKGIDYVFGANTPGYFNFNQPVTVLDRWQFPGKTGAANQRYNASNSLYFPFDNAANNSDAAFVDASFARLKNLSLSWQLPDKWLNKAKLASVSLFIQAQNLFTITNYKGLDPETLSTSSMPPLRMTTLGLQVGF